MQHIKTPTILVIVGISGDLSKRKLLPAIQQIANAGILPQECKIVGITRQKLLVKDIVTADVPFLRDNLILRQMDLTEPTAYARLEQALQDLEATFNAPAQRLFYLSVPPSAARPVINHLGEAGFGAHANTKLLLEKPFGTDYESAIDMVDQLHRHFTENQVYRIDHYLAKQMAQNLLVFRAGNSLFKRTWNKDFIESIEVIASEKIGIEGRAAFYEQTGALRDVVQSHLLQLAALALMELPNDSTTDIPQLRQRALEQLQLPQHVSTQVVRAQYATYRTEVNNPHTTVETFVRLTLFSKNPRWQNVPIILTTGKALSTKSTEIRITYRQQDTSEANRLVLRIQPNEGVEFDLWAKQPDYEHQLKKLPLDFSYSSHFDSLPDAYEQVFVDAMRGDRSLFTTGQEVLASWRILQPIQQHWDMANDDLIFYEPASEPDSIKAINPAHYSS